MNKKLYIFLSSLLLGTSSFGQIQDGSTAPDFTFTDIYGNVQNLYSYLDQGKNVAIDISATWCVPCWQYHNEQVMDSIYDLHDTPGDNQWKIIFLEADGSTDSADLYGLTTGSQGDWVQGRDYIILNPPTGIDLSNLQIGYEFSYYPTFLMICANKKVFQTALNGPTRPTVAMWEAVAGGCFPAGMDNMDDREPVTVYPNPAVTATTLYFSLNSKAAIRLSVTNIIGQQMDEVVYGTLLPGDQSLKYNVSGLPAGVYVFTIFCGDTRVIKKKVLVQ